ncbi:hypothetical protein WA588_005530 [Blastocystis sp. NMH]
MISFDYWTHSQRSIPEQRCFVDSVKWFYRTNSDNRLEVRMQEEKDEVAVVLSCTPAVFRFIPLRQPVCEGQDALFLPKQSFVTIVNTITSSVVPLTPLALSNKQRGFEPYLPTSPETCRSFYRDYFNWSCSSTGNEWCLIADSVTHEFVPRCFLGQALNVA